MIEDDKSAKYILEKEYGLEVQLLGLNKLAEQYLGNDWGYELRTSLQSSFKEEKQITENPSNQIMVVKRRSNH